MVVKLVKKSIQKKSVKQKPRPRIGDTGNIIKTLIGESILQARLKKNLTRPQLSDRINVSSKSIQKWEEGEAFPDDLSVFNLIEIILGVKGGAMLDNALKVAKGGDKKAIIVIAKMREKRMREKIKKSKISAKKRKNK